MKTAPYLFLLLRLYELIPSLWELWWLLRHVLLGYVLLLLVLGPDELLEGVVALGAEETVRQVGLVHSAGATVAHQLHALKECHVIA